MLIVALNPCPCGFWGSSRCECMPHLVEKYRRKISVPVADRIDMWVSVGEMPPESLSTQTKRGSGETKRAREAVAAARARQRARFAGLPDASTNSDMGPKEIESLAELTEKAEEMRQGG